MEDRLEYLESTVAQQDRLLEQLNDIVTSQQRQIDEMEKKLMLLGQRIRHLAQNTGDGPADLPPPHYGSTL